MKEILQLFKRDAEYAPQNPSVPNYDLGAKPRVLAPQISRGNTSSREGSVIIAGERRATPPVVAKTMRSEDPVYGRRW
jgi:hypothetical protein